jgi:predicted ribosome quality control (RQC) complex YloA/Tae2 family protein
MINNYHTLREILREAEPRLLNAEIIQCYTQERNRLVISLSSESEDSSLIISCEPRMNFLYLRNTVHRARKNTFDTLTNIRGKRITDIILHRSDRHITMVLEDVSRVIIQFFGARSNVYEVDQDFTITDAFLHPKDVVGHRAESPKDVSELPDTYDSFRTAVFDDAQITLKQSLRRSLVLFGATLHKELAARSRTDLDTEIRSIPVESRTHLWDSYVEIMEELSQPSPRIYYDESIPVEMGLIHLMQYYGKPERPFQSCSDAVRTFVNVSHKRQTVEHEKKNIQTRLSNELRKAERAAEAIHNELAQADRAEEYEHLGTVIISHPQVDTKGKQTIEVPDVFESREIIAIQVDPKLTTIENAERYFLRARKARQARKEAERRALSVERRLHELQDLIRELKSIDEPKDLKNFFNKHQKTLTALGIRMAKESKEELPFRVFRVAGDYEVWAGKSSANNDLLTMKYAKPNDLWFHARGAGGSHVVLKTGGSKVGIPKEAVEQAASIAAYYSKMRTSKLVPVAMTDRKYVRKRKGDPPGTVVLSRERVIMVKPGLPEGEGTGIK